MTSINSDDNLENLVPRLRESCSFLNPGAHVNPMGGAARTIKVAGYTSPIVVTLLNLDDFVTPYTYKSQ